MTKNIYTTILLFIGILILQILVLNKINIWGLATPFLYLYLIVALPVNFSNNLSLIIAFLLGFIVDIFSNTPGMNAMAAVVTAFVRIPLLTLITREESNNTTPQLFNTLTFIRYTLPLLLVFLTTLYVIEAFSLFSFWRMLIKIFCSGLVTLLLFFCMESLKTRKK